MDLNDCQGLLAHAEWADALMWESVSALGREDVEVRDKLHHLHLVQWAYLQVWRGEPVALRDASAFATSRAIRTWAREYYRELPAYWASLGDADVKREVRFPWADDLVQRFGKAQAVAWSESVVQIAMHSSYHRGQLARRIRELGSDPPLTDFVAWLWMGRPAADWGAEAASQPDAADGPLP